MPALFTKNAVNKDSLDMTKTNTPSSGGSGGLNVDTSIVDYLKSQGQDSSMTARKELASQYGIKNYSGSYDQNVSLLSMVKNGAPPTTTKEEPKVETKKEEKKEKKEKKDNVVVDTPTVSEAPSTTSSDPVLTGVDQSVIDVMTSTYQYSPAVTEAMKYADQLLAQLSTGKTSLTDQVGKMVDAYVNRDKFSYDSTEDPLFQQMLAQSMASGQTAMQDTMGQASALTGGYGSSYSQAVGNSAYNNFVQDAYANLPDYYNLALSAYEQEGQQMLNQINQVKDLDQTEYERLYNAYMANQDNAQTKYQNSYREWSDIVDNAFNFAGMLNTDAWNKLYLAEDQRQFDETMDFNYAGLEQNQNQFDASLKYDYDSLAQNNNQFNASLKQDNDQYYAGLNQSNTQFWADYLQKQEALKNEQTLASEPTQDMYAEAMRAYQTGGDVGFAQWLRTLPSNINTGALKAYVGDYGANGGDALGDFFGGGTTDPSYKAPSDSMYQTALEKAVSGGEGGMISYLDTISEYDGGAIEDWVESKLTFTFQNGVFVDGFGQTYSKVADIVSALGLTKDQKTKLNNLAEGKSVTLYK